MILDTLANAGAYSGLHKNLKAAFDYLQGQDLEAMSI